MSLRSDAGMRRDVERILRRADRERAAELWPTWRALFASPRRREPVRLPNVTLAPWLLGKRLNGGGSW